MVDESPCVLSRKGKGKGKGKISPFGLEGEKKKRAAGR